MGFPGDVSGKNKQTNKKQKTNNNQKKHCQRRRNKRAGFDPWVDKIPWRRAWQHTPVFLPGESPWPEETGGLQLMGSHSQTQLSD